MTPEKKKIVRVRLCRKEQFAIGKIVDACVKYGKCTKDDEAIASEATTALGKTVKAWTVANVRKDLGYKALRSNAVVKTVSKFENVRGFIKEVVKILNDHESRIVSIEEALRGLAPKGE